ncbi:MAG: FAD-dependent oxidoreductase [Roseiflexaceae bacterium]
MTIASEQRPLWVAVVGAGPAGFYAIESLLKGDAHVRVDIIERLPTPFGLVRSGVAPDHQSIKGVTRIYDKLMADPRVRFFGNVTVGSDITHDELLAHYDQIIYAVGAQSDRKMGIPGEELVGSAPATSFVGWYNGHPDYRDAQFNLEHERVVVIGNGNVAMDVTRILMAPIAELATTDMADHAIDSLRQSQVKQVVMLGRRGPVQAAFTTPELKEFGDLHGVDVYLDAEDFVLDPASEAQLANDKVATRNMDVMRQYLERTPEGLDRSIHMRFMWSPVQILGENGRVTGVVIERNRLVDDGNGSVRAEGIGDRQTIACGMVLRSVGYRSVALAGVPFDERRGLFPNVDGRLTDGPGGTVLPRTYVVGWAKRGPSGIIGTNKPDSVATVNSMKADWEGLSDLAAVHRDGSTVAALIASRIAQVVDYASWQAIDAHEIAMGAPQERPRVKLTRVADMLDVAKQR